MNKNLVTAMMATLAMSPYANDWQRNRRLMEYYPEPEPTWDEKRQKYCRKKLRNAKGRKADQAKRREQC